MSMFTPSVTEAQALTALGNFLVTVSPGIPGGNVIQGQTNRVSPPPEPEYIVFTPMRREQLSQSTTNANPSNPDGPSVDISSAYAIIVQIDVHGDASGDTSQVIASLFRSGWGVDFFSGSNVTPLFSEDPQQLAFLTGEEQQENRWTFSVHLQITPVVSTPVQFASSLTVKVAVPADSGAP